jgi:hypothetical protein
MQVNDPLSMFSGDMMTVNVNLSGLPVSANTEHEWLHRLNLFDRSDETPSIVNV